MCEHKQQDETRLKQTLATGYWPLATGLRPFSHLSQRSLYQNPELWFYSQRCHSEIYFMTQTRFAADTVHLFNNKCLLSVHILPEKQQSTALYALRYCARDLNHQRFISYINAVVAIKLLTLLPTIETKPVTSVPC
jgi:hypothetical protein